jgi:cleavage and polyadenylation specificity factor subunit 1
MHAIRHELLPASGVEHACGLRLTPATLVPRHVIAARALYNVVVARSNLLRVFEVRADASPLAPDAADGRESVRRGTEAVEGEVAMDEGGEGFMHIGGGKVNAPRQPLVVGSPMPLPMLMQNLFSPSLEARRRA